MEPSKKSPFLQSPIKKVVDYYHLRLNTVCDHNHVFFVIKINTFSVFQETSGEETTCLCVREEVDNHVFLGGSIRA